MREKNKDKDSPRSRNISSILSLYAGEEGGVVWCGVGAWGEMMVVFPPLPSKKEKEKKKVL